MQLKKASRISRNGKSKSEEQITQRVRRMIDIPALQSHEMCVTISGDRPLMVNNKMNVAEDIAKTYGGPGGKASATKMVKATDDEAYSRAFYVMPSSKAKPPSPKALYGVPASGLKKCFDKAIRTTGITDNTTIGQIGRSFFVLEDEAGLCLIKFKRLERDIRAVNIGSGQKTVPSMRHRPMFHDWSIDLRIKMNPLMITPEAIINLINHAGQYIGICEMRAEKKQGQCGGFYVSGVKSKS